MAVRKQDLGGQKARTARDNKERKAWANSAWSTTSTTKGKRR